MPSPLSWLLSWLLNEVAGCGGAGTEPPNFDFCCCCWLAISCPMLTCHCAWLCNVPCMAAFVSSMVASLLLKQCLASWESWYPRPEKDMRPPCCPLEASSQFCLGSCGRSHLATTHLELATRTCLSDQLWVGSRQCALVGTSGKVLLARTLCN